ncbi:hypothetical protein PLESTF_000327900 [Pleodorina starrii]|nr:hypothetical protein PLESTF_000327900 [Pleodorina starrii]
MSHRHRRCLRNVAIHKADSSSHVPPGEVPDDPFQLELLSTAMYHKSMGARLAAPQQQQHMQMQQYTQQQAGGGDDDGENLGATQPAAARRGAGGGRGKQGGGGAKRAKRAAAEPLGDVNMDD